LRYRRLGQRAKPLVEVIDSLTHVVFRMVSILMIFAPIGAFGAMAYTVGKFGLASLGPLAKLIGTFWLTSTALCRDRTRRHRVGGAL
jgi:aerobic C4-dicarboxylate transport protein